MTVSAKYFAAGTEAPWDEAECYSLVDNLRGGAPKVRTEMRALWTDDAVWFRFFCEDERAVATKTRFNANLFKEDVAEVFIAPPARDRKKYYEFEIAPNGNAMHLAIRNPRGWIYVKKIAKEYFREVVRDGENWTVTFALPFDFFRRKTPKDGEIWHMNGFRCDVDPKGDGHRQDLYALSPTRYVKFHRPKHFVPLVFEKSGK